MRRNKGITLIALIITIIVMLILVAVSVNVLIKSNLIGTAEKAVDKYKTASEEEANEGTIEINGKKYASIEDYIEGKEAITEVHNWERTGDNLICNHCNRTVTIGQELDYKDNGKGTSKISGDMSGVSQGIADGKLTAADFGTDGEQTINKDSETKWVVLGIEDSNNNGTNETLLLTTLNPTTEEITMYGAAAYNNCIDEINRMCRELYGEEARGMTIEDVTNCCQHTAPSGMCEVTDGRLTWTYYVLKPNTTISNLDSSYGNVWSDIQNNSYEEDDGTKKYFTPSYPEGSLDLNILGNTIVNGSEYSWYYGSSDNIYFVNGTHNTKDTNNKITLEIKNLIFGETSYAYWLASNGVYAVSYLNDGRVYFGPGTIAANQACSSATLFNHQGYSWSANYSLRAVVSLRSDIPAVVE